MSIVGIGWKANNEDYDYLFAGAPSFGHIVYNKDEPNFVKILHMSFSGFAEAEVNGWEVQFYLVYDTGVDIATLKAGLTATWNENDLGVGAQFVIYIYIE